jgi:hypothetical protein
MPVISHQVTRGNPQLGGRVYATYEFMLDTGSVVTVGPRLVDVGAEDDLEAAAMWPQVNAQVVQADYDALVLNVTQGEPVLDQVPAHPSNETEGERKRLFRRWFFRQMVRRHEVKVVRAMLYDLWLWLKNDSGYTSQQIASYLDVSVAQLATWDGRMQAIHDNLAFLDGDQGEEIE